MADDEIDDPFQSDDPAVWYELIRSVHEAGLLVSIRHRLGVRLSQLFDAEDVLQEVLQRVWVQRHSIEWRGLAAFKSYLLTAANHRIRDLADHLNAQKRGGEKTIHSFSVLGGDTPEGVPYPGPWLTTTPSRLAILREQADTIEAALASVDSDCREVVRLRLFEGESVSEIGTRIGLGSSGVRHRLRRGLHAYREALRKQLTSRTLRSLEE